ncbi:MAG: protein translocase subunit SecD, partial [Flavobacteriales bacterium]
IIKKRIDQFGVSQPTIQKQLLTGRIIVELPGVDNPDRIIGIIGTTANLEFWDTYRTDEVTGKILEIFSTIGKKTAPDLYSQDPEREKKDSLMRVAMQVPGLDSLAQDSIRKLYADNTVTPDSLLSEKDLARKYPLRGKFQPIMQSGVAVLGQSLVGDTATVNAIFNMPEARVLLPNDLKLAWESKANANVVSLYGLKAATGSTKSELDGKHIVDARQTFSEVGAVEVTMNMDIEGAGIWRKMTAKNASDKNRPIAIVMDGKVISAPSVQSEIPNGSSVITFGNPGNDNTKVLEEATDLAGLLKAGSLPAPARIIDQVTVGPSLGAENIQAGIWSFIIAFIVILIYMVFYYAWAGWAANVALVANLFFLIGALVSLGGSLTLPGIAGIVLTMGMAVDANVLIYERVKEELRLGKGMSAAMKDGFIKALSAIIDGNATTLLTGLVLFYVGTGPIRGFATTLIIGIFTTLFTALLVSRLILYRRLDSKKPITFYSNITKNWFTKMNFDFVKKRYVYYAISASILIAGGISALTRGDNAFNVGVEFKGGTSAKISFAQSTDDEAVRAALATNLVEANGQVAPITVQRVNNDGKQFKITTGYLSGSEVENVDLLVKQKITDSFKGREGFVIDSVNKVDPSMSDDFRKEAYWATIISLLLVGVYIMIRFRKWDFAVGATVALFHDALIVIAAFTLLNGIVPFSLEINQNFIGAILTIVGYSINDTVVIFDRIREYFNTRKNAPLESTINDALNSTLGRSINTSMTVLLTLLVMFVFGSDDIRGFCFAMIIGVISGVYSTLFIASPIVVDMRKLFKGKSSSDANEDKKTVVKAATA